jgi:hypothetical protein
VQGITTIEPDERQLEVALASLRVTLVREAEAAAGAAAAAVPVVQRFPSFATVAEAFGGMEPRGAV